MPVRRKTILEAFDDVNKEYRELTCDAEGRLKVVFEDC